MCREKRYHSSIDMINIYYKIRKKYTSWTDKQARTVDLAQSLVCSHIKISEPGSVSDKAA